MCTGRLYCQKLNLRRQKNKQTGGYPLLSLGRGGVTVGFEEAQWDKCFEKSD